ncbi:MAG: hypothetical protein ACREID_02600 [Planctomycetota bacterium]
MQKVVGVLAALIAYLVLNPLPALEAALGWALYPVGAALLVLLTLVAVGVAILRNLPGRVGVAPLPESGVSPNLKALEEQYARLGFQRAGPPLAVRLFPPAILVPFVNAKEAMYGTAFLPRGMSGPTFDFVTVLEGGRGGLTSAPKLEAGVLPAAPGDLRQIFPGLAPGELLDRHREAVRWLRDQGFAPRKVSAETFSLDFTASFARLRRAFLQAPVRNTVRALVRVLTRKSPHLGPVDVQAHGAAEVARMVAGPVAEPVLHDQHVPANW